ncbi:class F sortase [Nonomuraea deserti]|uniref:Class F sortase n=1 Tax=Nonomuraea deserti TaxID=1848322 RepID=A0A4R4TZA8_9ACTN|nr:class F sortase [Nonomuraea deserti]TDC84137.1 class F sortase [Nonomuraea deserti]
MTAAACALLAVGACATVPDPARHRTAGTQAAVPAGPQARAQAPARTGAQAASGYERWPAVPVAGSTAEAAAPVRLRVPAIKLSTKVIPLRLDTEGRLVAPKSFDRVGWNEAGPEPGERGVAVVAGHVDSTTGPAVFHRLRDLRRGDRVHVDRADGSTVTFVVGRVTRYPKSRVPDKEVYHGGRGAELRLITCGGTFDRARRSYRDNVIVFAR